MRDTMALQLRRTASMRVRLVTTLIAAFAFIVQPYVGIIASQNVNALAVTPSIAKLDTYFVKSNYKGIATDITVNNLTDANGVKVEVSRAIDGSIVKTAETSVLNALNTGSSATVTAPIVIQSGSYSEIESNSWSMPAGSPWTSATTPTSVTVTITRDGGDDLVATKTINPTMGPFATLAEVMPAPAPAPAPVDPTDSHSLNLKGTIYRDISLNNCDNSTECKAPNRAENLSGWTVNLYKENPSDSSDWNFVQSATTDSNGEYKLGAHKEAGVYHTCVAMQNGWSQSAQTWSGSGYLVKTVNQSSEGDEGSFCTTNNYDDTGDRSSNSRIGVVDTTDPSINFLSPSRFNNSVYDQFFQNLSDITIEGTDNQTSVVSTVVHIYNEDGSISSAWCGAAIVGDTGSCDTTSLIDGKYYVKVAATDTAGNSEYAKKDFVIDSTAPSVDDIKLNGQSVSSPRDSNGGPTNFYPVGSKVSLSATIDDNLSGVVDAKYKIRKVTPSGNTQTGVYQSGTVNMSDGGSGEWKTLSGDELDVSGLPEGTYTIMMMVKDKAGNLATPYVDITVDHTAPNAPTITKPSARQWFKTTPIQTTWSSVTDPSDIDHYQVAYSYDDGHTFGGSDCPTVTTIESKAVSGCRNENGTSRNHSPGSTEEGGVTIWVRAFDKAGNPSDWSDSVHYYYDHEAPTTTLVAPTGLVGNSFTVSGDAIDNLGLNRVYVQLVNRENNQRYGGTTINLIPEGVDAHWSKTFDANALNLPDGNYAAHVSVTDMAGNSSSAGWTANFAVESTAPTTTVSVNDTTNPTTATVTINDANPQGKYVINAYHVSDSSKNARVCGLVDFANGETTAICNITGLADGEYYLKANVLDKVGNNSASVMPDGGAYSEHFVIDTTAPDNLAIQFNEKNSGDIVSNSGITNEEFFTFNLTANGNPDRWQLRYWNDIADASFNDKNHPWVQSNVNGYSSSLGVYNDRFSQGEGTHYFAFSACDIIGNCSDYSEFKVTYDKTPPSVAIDPLAPLTNDNTPTVTGTIELGASLKLKENGVIVTPTITGTTWSYTPSAALADAEYEYIAMATDAASNVSEPVTSKVIVDTLAPSFTVVDYGQTGNVIQPNVNYTPSAGDSYFWSAAPAGVTISDATALRPTFTVTQDGNYSFDLTIRDAAGNEDTKTFNFTYKNPVTLTPDVAAPNAFTGVTLTNATTAPVTLAADGDGVQAVLGATDTNADATEEKLAAVNTSDVKGAETTATQADNKAEAGCGTFLGICWYWWIPIVLAAILAAYYLFRPRREEV